MNDSKQQMDKQWQVQQDRQSQGRFQHMDIADPVARINAGRCFCKPPQIHRRVHPAVCAGFELDKRTKISLLNSNLNLNRAAIYFYLTFEQVSFFFYSSELFLEDI